VANRLQLATSIEDLRRMAFRRVPQMFYDYVDAGSWTEGTYRDNSAALARLRFRQRVAVNIASRNQRSVIAGEVAAMPLVLAPAGLTGMQYPDGEIVAARAAERYGVPFSLSTMSICSIEDVAAHTQHPFWFQLYMMRDRGFMERLIGRAHAANCSALILTLDLPVQGLRAKDLKNGLSAPPRPTLHNLLNLATRPQWCLGMLRTRRHGFGNIAGHVSGVSDMRSLVGWVNEQFDQTVTWDDVRWVRRLWNRTLIIKGILDIEDARSAAAAGADAIVVSNHGGRQLDGAPAAIDALPAIAATAGKLEVLFDSGIRSGQDVLRAIALGAKGVLIGRAYLYGLAAAGEAGVYRALEIIQRELDLTMALCGLNEIAAAGPHVLYHPHHPSPAAPHAAAC
jgi:L-lactate dehydrogenase (cytochrome)